MTKRYISVFVRDSLHQFFEPEARIPCQSLVDEVDVPIAIEGVQLVVDITHQVLYANGSSLADVYVGLYELLLFQLGPRVVVDDVVGPIFLCGLVSMDQVFYCEILLSWGVERVLLLGCDAEGFPHGRCAQTNTIFPEALLEFAPLQLILGSLEPLLYLTQLLICPDLPLKVVEESLQLVLLLSFLEGDQSSIDVASLKRRQYLSACFHGLRGLCIGVEEFADYALDLQQCGLFGVDSLFAGLLTLGWQHAQYLGDIYVLLIEVFIGVVQFTLLQLALLDLSGRLLLPGSIRGHPFILSFCHYWHYVLKVFSGGLH